MPEPDLERAAAVVRRVEQQRWDIVDLATAVSLAVRVEPGLLRRARLELTRGVTVAAEADIWASPLVASHNVHGFVLDRGVATVLRGRLAADPARCAATGRLVRDLHVHAAATLRLEEEALFEALMGNEERVGPLLERALQTIHVDADRGPGIARWAERAVAALPQSARESPEARELTAISARLLRDSVDVGVELLQGGIAISERPAPSAHVLGLPPDRLEITVSFIGGRSQTIEVVRGEVVRRRLRSPAHAVTIEIRTPDGQVAHLTPAGESAEVAEHMAGSTPEREPPVVRKGRGAAGPHDELLARFQPVLRYDSNEQFFADSAAQLTVNPGNELRRKPTPDGNGAVIARAVPESGEPRLDLAFLGPRSYADGTPVQVADVIGITGRDYREQYRSLRIAHPELNNVVYGHAVESDGRLWLQYWLWYFYNDYQLSFALGTHEGDWEMVQFRMDEEAGHPDIGVYAQHRFGEMRPWDGVEKFQPGGERPVVYVARGSHASYFEAGLHQTVSWYDLADGKRRLPNRPTLEILGTDEPAWVRWPGRWGDTVARDKTLHSSSPTGPGAKRHWTQPDRLLDNPSGVTKRGAAPAAPDVAVRRSGGRLRIDYDVATQDPRPHTLVMTVSSRDERGLPPQTHTMAVQSSGRASVTTEVVLDPLKRYDVSTSMIAGDPPVPSESRVGEIEPFDAPSLSPRQRVLAYASFFVARRRGKRRRA